MSPISPGPSIERAAHAPAVLVWPFLGATGPARGQRRGTGAVGAQPRRGPGGRRGGAGSHSWRTAPSGEGCPIARFHTGPRAIARTWPSLTAVGARHGPARRAGDEDRTPNRSEVARTAAAAHPTGRYRPLVAAVADVALAIVGRRAMTRTRPQREHAPARPWGADRGQGQPVPVATGDRFHHTAARAGRGQLTAPASRAHAAVVGRGELAVGAPAARESRLGQPRPSGPQLDDQTTDRWRRSPVQGAGPRIERVGKHLEGAAVLATTASMAAAISASSSVGSASAIRRATSSRSAREVPRLTAWRQERPALGGDGSRAPQPESP